MYKGVEETLGSTINALTVMLPGSASAHEYKKKLFSINELVQKRFYLQLQDFNAINELEEKRKDIERKGLTGDRDVDNAIKLYKLLSKIGYIKSD